MKEKGSVLSFLVGGMLLLISGSSWIREASDVASARTEFFGQVGLLLSSSERTASEHMMALEAILGLAFFIAGFALSEEKKEERAPQPTTVAPTTLGDMIASGELDYEMNPAKSSTTVQSR